MTESTKNLFDAPWYVFSSPDDETTVIENESGRVLAELDDVKTANRLARLPELYDALKQATEDVCWKCSSVDNIFVPCRDLHANECYVAQWRELLRKVRDGV